ncbi:MAG: DNA-3-methyladenine glycosylase I [Sphingorhabdus sp.]
MTVIGTDGKHRCFGGQAGKEFYGDYHDQEWGFPVHDDRLLFENLILEGAQAGLSWETVLRKRDGYRRAFHGFDIALCAAMDDEELEMLREDAGIIRNRLKIFSVRKNALVFLEIQREFGSFDAWLWAHLEGTPPVNRPGQFSDMASTSPISDLISKTLKKRGMSFVGSTIIYAYMQAIGMTDDHLAGCWKA